VNEEKKPEHWIKPEMLNNPTAPAEKILKIGQYMRADGMIGDMRDLEHVEVLNGVRIYPKPSQPVMSLDEFMKTQIAARHNAKEKILAGEAPLVFPQVVGVSQETLALIHRQEAWPVESMSVEERLKNRRELMAKVSIEDLHRGFSRRVKFAPGFIDTLEDHLDDIERMRLRKRKNRRKTTKKRKQRLMGKR
jgi:hypothetical protein